ncbi:MAG: nucleotidyltransferase [Chlorobi bacterium]|nr:nucleotidyltransferase [Chlorobiota bacterium]
MDALGKFGETIIDYSIYDAYAAGIRKVVFVIRKNIEEEFNKEILDKLPSEIKTEYVFQEIGNVPGGLNYSHKRQKPWGTGHAVLTASSAINEPFIVINADDFYGRKSYQTAVDFFTKTKEKESRFALVGYKLNQTLSDFGFVSRGICGVDENGFLKTIAERTRIKREKGKIFFEDEDGEKRILSGNEIVSMNMFFFTPDIFERLEEYFKKFLKENADNLKAEFYLPFVVNNLIAENKTQVKVLPSAEKWFGLTYKEDKASAKEKISKLIKEKKYPDKLWR